MSGIRFLLYLLYLVYPNCLTGGDGDEYVFEVNEAAF